jgi:hypothetical protein
VPWAPHLVLGIANNAPLDVIEDAHDWQIRLYEPNGLLTAEQNARATRRVEAIRRAFQSTVRTVSDTPSAAA